jgi:hypothetical protein
LNKLGQIPKFVKLISKIIPFVRMIPLFFDVAD